MKRNDLFEKEKQRQWKLVSCVEKIEVKYHGHPRDCTLIMNKEISTPFHCAMRKLCPLVMGAHPTIECIKLQLHFM